MRELEMIDELWKDIDDIALEWYRSIAIRR